MPRAERHPLWVRLGLAVGRSLGLTEAELDAVIGDGPVDVLAAGRALAKLESAR